MIRSILSLAVLVFSISSIADELSGIDVKSSMFTNSIEESKYPLHIIENDFISDVNSLGKNLENLPGVSNADYGPAIGQPVIRGLSGSRTKVMLNNDIVNSLMHLSADHLNNVNIQEISHIEILRGPSSIFAGSGASGGIVNVVSDVISGDKYDNDVTSYDYYSVNNGFGHNVTIKRNILNTNIFFNINNKHLKNQNLPHGTKFEEGLFKGTLANSDYKDQNMIVGISMPQTWGYIGFSFENNDGNYGIPFHAEEEEEEHHEEEEEHRVHSKVESETYTIKGKIDTIPFFNSMDFSLVDSNAFLREHEEDGSASLDNNLTAVSGKFNLDSSNYERRVLVEYARTKSPMTDAYIPPSIAYDRSISFFQRNLGKPYELDFAIRYESNSRDNHNQRYGDTSLNLGSSLLYKLSESTNLYLGYSHVSRSPNIAELFANGSHGPTQRYERGNSQLSREVSRGAEIGLTTEYKDFEIDLRLYDNDINNYIYLKDRTTSTGGKTDADWRQKDATFRGYELSISKSYDIANGLLQATLSTDDVSAVFDDNTYVPRAVPAKTVLSLQFDTQNNETFTADLSYTDDQGDFSSIETKTNSYVGLDMKYSRGIRLAGSDMLISVFGENLTNSSQRNHSSFVKNEVPLQGVRVGLELSVDYDM